MIENIFSVPIYSTIVNNFIDIQTEIEDAIDIIDNQFFMKKEWGDTHYISDVSFTDNIIHECSMDVFFKEIHDNIKKYRKVTPFGNKNIRYSLAGDPKITASWITKFVKNNYSAVHDHGPDDISGCYYYKTSGSDGDFFFESPSNWGGRHTITPKEGQLILFPSWLKHGVTTNNTKNTRMSVAFNIKFER